MNRQSRAVGKLLGARLVFLLWLVAGCELPRAQAPPQAVAAPPAPKPARKTPPPNLYAPRPKIEWGRQEGGTAERTVVVIASRFASPGTYFFGNGVIVGGGGATIGARVLTCAHLLARDGEPALETRVGILAHSFEPPVADAPEYQEVPAKVLLSDAKADLALIEIEPPRTLRAAALADSGALEEHHVISIVPFGEPTHERAWYPRLRPGMSGSPSFDPDGRCEAIAQAATEFVLVSKFADATDIRKLLENVGQAAAPEPRARRAPQ